MGALQSIWGTLESLSAVAIIAAIGAFLLPITRDWIFKRIARKIDYDFEVRLEKLRSELTATENRLKTVTEVALASISGRQTALDSRRLKAVENLWVHKSRLDSLRMVAKMMGAINFEVAAKEIGKYKQAQELFQVLLKSSGYENWLSNKEKDGLPPLGSERPFISPVVWALYSAYASTLTMPLTKLALLANGVNNPELINEEGHIQILKAALPEYAEYLDKNGSAGTHLLIDDLEKKIYDATCDMLSGKVADAEALAYAARISNIANGLNSESVAEEKLEAQIPKELRATAPEAPSKA